MIYSCITKNCEMETYWEKFNIKREGLKMESHLKTIILPRATPHLNSEVPKNITCSTLSSLLGLIVKIEKENWTYKR